MSMSTLIDENIILSLKELLAENFEQLVISFVSDGAQRVNRLKEAVNSDDWSSVCMESHALKGSSRNIGAEAFAELCAQVEDQARKEDSHDLAKRAERIEYDFAILCEELKNFL